MSGQRLFRPADGAVLDLESLQAIPTALESALDAWLRALSGEQSPGLVLEGLELQGAPASDQEGPPGAVNVPDDARLTLTPGRAVLREGQGGRPCLVEIPRPLSCPVAPSARGGERVLLLTVRQTDVPVRPGAQVRAASVQIEPGVAVVTGDRRGAGLPLAVSAGTGRTWCTDLHRLWSPDHLELRRIFGALDELVGPTLKGSIWEQRVQASAALGTADNINVQRNQFVAVAAVQATRAALAARPTTTDERTRQLALLLDQLRRVNPDSAEALRRRFVQSDLAEPYFQRLRGVT